MIQILVDFVYFYKMFCCSGPDSLMENLTLNPVLLPLLEIQWAVGFEVFTAVLLKSEVVQDVMLCCWSSRSRCFRGSCCLLFQIWMQHDSSKCWYLSRAGASCCGIPWFGRAGTL